MNKEQIFHDFEKFIDGMEITNKADAIDKYLEVAEYDNWQEVAELLEGYPL
jgi:hypothetical protein